MNKNDFILRMLDSMIADLRNSIFDTHLNRMRKQTKLIMWRHRVSVRDHIK